MDFAATLLNGSMRKNAAVSVRRSEVKNEAGTWNRRACTSTEASALSQGSELMNEASAATRFGYGDGCRYRHELKHLISPGDMIILRQRLQLVADSDRHAEYRAGLPKMKLQGGNPDILKQSIEQGKDLRKETQNLSLVGASNDFTGADDSALAGKSYRIRSLYFDTPSDKALKEKIYGVSRRIKFRLRYYNDDTSNIFLEKKAKLDGVGYKESARLSKEEAHRLCEGDLSWMPGRSDALITELYARMVFENLRPVKIVDYTREPYVYAPGNVRVTIDYDIRAGLSVQDFTDPDSASVPVPDDPIILEVKWDDFLPGIIRDCVGLPGRRETAFSKYAAARAYD